MSVEITTTKHRSIVRLRWRTRLRYWWHRRRLGKVGRAVEDALAAEVLASVLHGVKNPDCGHRGGCLGPRVAANRGGCRMQTWSDVG